MAHLDLVPRCEYAEEKRYINKKKKFKNARKIAIFVAVKMRASSSTIMPSKIADGQQLAWKVCMHVAIPSGRYDRSEIVPEELLSGSVHWSSQQAD
jgi:translation elongation factor EF-Ts